MGAADYTNTEAVRTFVNKLQNNEISNPRDLKIKEHLDELAKSLADKHQSLRDAVNAIDLDAHNASYIRLTTAEEFGLTLYLGTNWEDSPPEWFQKWLAESELHRLGFDILKSIMKDYEHYKMSQAEYDTLMKSASSPGLIANDGTYFGTGKYEQMDEKWMIAALNYVLNIVHSDDIYAPFPNPVLTAAPLTLKPTSAHAEPVLGILGDWGAGFYNEPNGVGGTIPCPAQRVAADLSQHSIDYLIHLGDTYYAGTDGSRLGPDSANEEQENLINVWPDQGTGRNYTLNSNHEMYGAAQGYFNVALRRSGFFNQQNGASVFAMTYPLKIGGNPTGKSWLVLGLDSAYYSDKENGIKMYMDGAIGSKKFLDEHKKQIHMIENICAGHKGPIMVMTHHNPCDTITTKTNILYDQVVSAIGRAPSLWVWGHVHNAIVYDQMIISDDKPVFITSMTKSRCCGHGAVPFGPAWGLEGRGDIAYYAHTHDDQFPADVPRVKNGYALYTLHDDGGFTENFYEVGNPEKPAFSKKWTPDQVYGN